VNSCIILLLPNRCILYLLKPECFLIYNCENKNDEKNKYVVFFIHKIAKTDFCEAEPDWPRAKSNYKAIKYCINAVGLKTRKCNGQVWENVISSCVNEDLDDIQKRVEVSLFNIQLTHSSLLFHSSFFFLEINNRFFLFIFFTFIITGIK